MREFIASFYWQWTISAFMDSPRNLGSGHPHSWPKLLAWPERPHTLNICTPMTTSPNDPPTDTGVLQTDPHNGFWNHTLPLGILLSYSILALQTVRLIYLYGLFRIIKSLFFSRRLSCYEIIGHSITEARGTMVLELLNTLGSLKNQIAYAMRVGVLFTCLNARKVLRCVYFCLTLLINHTSNYTLL